MLEKRKLAINSVSMLTNRLVQSISTFVLTASIARLLGAYELGQYLLAFSYYFTFVTLASQGLKTLFTRELARHPEKTPIYLVSGSFLQLLMSLTAYIFLVFLILLLPYSAATSNICIIMGLAIVPFALSNITESIFQGQEKMHLIAFSTVPVYILRLLIMLKLIHSNYGINYLAFVFVASETLILIAEWILVVQFVKPQWKIEKKFIWGTLQAAKALLAIDGIAVISSRLEIFLLSLLSSEILVGLYGGINQLIQPFLIVANSFAISMFPAMSRAVEKGKEEQREVTETFIRSLMLIALPFLIGILFTGHNLIVFVYGSDFAEAGLPFKLVAFSLLLMPFNRALSHVLVANGLERVNLREVITTTSIVGLIGVFLIPHFQLIGAAMMDFGATFIAFNQYMYATYNRLFTLRLWHIFMPSVLVSLVMIPVFLSLNRFSPSFLTTLEVSTAIYLLLIGLLSIHAIGGPRKAYSKILNRK
ncbi:MAG: oligosaccharide flippase family protein [Oculatellaceae cyanobacterium bins.114]|nr:oligosaccharide flippase family protein [Oculatellaceae cyanobacterium bins.114]